ncbi:MAG: PEP/pyruvate-binding domain-containing protein [archaeon]|nr:PEP/pyruvate-binding domain-containing protein [archaeon]
MTKEGDYVKWFSELSNKDVSIAGGKGASLAEMYNYKFPIPPGFVVTAKAYRHFIESTGLDKKINEILSGLDVEDTKKLEDDAEKIRKLIEHTPLPEDIAHPIKEAYDILDVNKEQLANATKIALDILKRSKEPLFVAVRSSATTEDLADASFAGQQETFVNVKGYTNLLEKVVECFASLFTARAIYYRIKKGFAHEKSYLAIVVQKMVNSDKSGVIFSKNPVSNADDIVIEAVFGLGEGIVSGRIKPDHYEIDNNLEKLNIKNIDIPEKKVAIVRDSAGNTILVKLTEDKGRRQVLNNHELKMLSQYALRLEEHYKKPQDIEFAISGTDIYIVQSRPITTKFKVAENREVVGDVLLSGFGASPGIASGIVRLVYNLKDLEKVKKGDVLVTEMTNPDMVISMQKATAIITDEGGVTCFSGDTKVLTSNGFMSIKEASELVNNGNGTSLLAYDSIGMKPVWKKIISAAGRKRQVMRISVSQTGRMEDNYIDLTGDHKMITFEGRNLIKEQIDSILAKEKHICLLDSLPISNRINNPKLSYLLGALLSDGCITIANHHTGNPRRGRITFTQKETPQKEDFIKTVRAYFEECFEDKFKDGRIKYSSGNIRGRAIQGFANDYICNNLKVAQTITKLTQNLDSWVLRLDNESCLNFLAGLIDGDGCLYQNRLHIYADKENVLQGVILACLNLGIFPQITRNRTIYHIQILERLNDILGYTKRVNGEITQKINGNKLMSAKQVLGDIVEKINFKGRVKPYVEENLLIDSNKIIRDIIPIAGERIKQELFRVINSGLRMQRVNKINELGEIDVYNLEIEADNELDHNFVVFTKKYTPLLVSNSHAAIVSREMGIPAVVGTVKATSTLRDGESVTVDGNKGLVYSGKGETKLAEVKQIVPTKTKIKVIVDLPDFAERAALSGVKDVGLTRLEGIIAGSGKHPLYYVKHKNMESYVDVLFNGLRKLCLPFNEIWIRTSDIRTDEFRNLEGAPKEVEGNPMLGNHGIRFSVKHKEILDAEIMAMKRIAEEYPDKIIGIMVPQVISVEDVRETKASAERIGVPKNVKIGIMVETPAAVQVINQLCEEGIKFISFGTNDLTQYMLAIDRNNEGVQYLYDEMNPAVLSALSYVIRRCRRYGVETSICGQAGSKEEMARFLVEEGISSVSVNADAAFKVSMLIAEIEKNKEGIKGVVEKVGNVVGQMIKEGGAKIVNEVKEIIHAGKAIENKIENKIEAKIKLEEKPKKEEHFYTRVAKIDSIKDSSVISQDIEEVILKELERDEYNPGTANGTEKNDIPPLNDAIPIDSSHFEPEREKEIKAMKEEFDLEKELTK